MKRFIMCITTAALVFTVASCSKDSSSVPGGSIDRSGTSMVTVDEGGRVYYNDEVTLSVPAQSVTEDTEIAIERVTKVPKGTATGQK